VQKAKKKIIKKVFSNTINYIRSRKPTAAYCCTTGGNKANILQS